METLKKRFVNARKRYITNQFRQLNDMQQKAVLATEGPLLLLAGAGSGKTTVLINRIANLIRFGRASDSEEIQGNVSERDVAFLENLPEEPAEEERDRADWLCALEPAAPWSILAITFTNKAANEMKDRLANLLGDCAQDIWAMTFHSACCRILRRDIEKMGYTRSFTIYDASDSERMMKGVVKDLGLDDKTFPAKLVLSVIGKQKDSMISPEEMLNAAEAASDIRLKHIARCYARYQTQLKENNALDFDDIIYVTVELLQQYPEVRDFYRRKFRYVLVDEYQDTNHMQYLLTSLLSGGNHNLCVVGDDDQSIYRFRGATIENILTFEKQFHNCRTIRLEQNYRSTQCILNAANGVISHNIGRKGKQLWTSNGMGNPITVYEAADERAEANFVVGKILSRDTTRYFRDYAVLYRTNAQSNALEFAMKRNNIPYRVIGGFRFFERAEIKDMLSYLCVINNRADDLRLLRIINNPARGLGPKALETAERLAEAEGKPLYSIVSDPFSYGPVEKYAKKFMEFTVLIENLARLLDEGMSLADFYDQVVEKTGYAEMLLAKQTEENITKLENVRELKSSILAYMENTDAPTLSGFLEEIALYTDLESYSEGDDAVVMMTMHSAKGLEFPAVFLVGFEDGLFPGMRAIGDAEEMEEERRLCYVAITRAKKDLYISHARQRMIFGRTTASLPSRFIQEIPTECIVKKGGYVSYNSQYTSQPQYAPNQFTAPKRSTYTTSSYNRPAEKINIDIRQGELISHSAFGRGMVLSVTPMGGDALLEIAFDDIGTKKLMAKAAYPHMKKL